MRKLIPALIVGLIFAIGTEFASRKDQDAYGVSYYKTQSKTMIVMLAIFWSVFCGLRTNYNDTITYRHMFEEMDITGSIFNVQWLRIGDNPGFTFVNQILHRLNFSTQNFLMFYAVITVCIYIWFFQKYSNHFLFSAFFFVTMGCYTFTLAAVKQSVAMAFCLVSTDRFLEKKYVHYLVWIGITMFFHPYSLMYLLLPFLTFTPWSFRTFGLLAAAGTTGVMLQSLLGTVVSITSLLGEEYNVESFTGEGVNLFRVAVVWAPILLSFVTRKHIRVVDNKKYNLFINLSMVNAMLMFIGLFGTANYFARLANYFLFFQIIMLPILTDFFERESRIFLCTMMVICYILYFYYATAITNGGFDANYYAMSFVDYLKQLIP